MSRKLDFEKDNQIDVTDLNEEFRVFPSVIYGYRDIEAQAQEAYDLKKLELKELRSAKNLEIRSREGKVTESTVEAMLDSDPDVKKAVRDMLSVKRDLETLNGYVESVRAKKDCLIQLSANLRKE